ncbi:MAG: guanylate kinase [Gemmataceae bacterium]
MTVGPLILVSGPSGSGKSTLIRRVLDDPPYPLRLAVSATTRPPRPGEIDGVHYHFWTEERFRRELDAGAFLEHAVVHGLYHYGTPRSEVDGYREGGIGVVLDIDVQGADQVRKLYPEHLSIFVALSRWEMYEERLRQRGSETPGGIARRLKTAECELACRDDYQNVVINDDLQQAVARFREILTGYRPSRK